MRTMRRKRRRRGGAPPPPWTAPAVPLLVFYGIEEVLIRGSFLIRIYRSVRRPVGLTLGLRISSGVLSATQLSILLSVWFSNQSSCLVTDELFHNTALSSWPSDTVGGAAVV